MEVLSLAQPSAEHARPGWCSYRSQLDESPDVEIFCGGINTKALTAAALWRQGQLMHFGFDLAPSEMSAVGRDLLLNAIVYISRFRQDRALLRMPSPFAGNSARSRDSLMSWLKKESYPLEWFEAAIDDELIGAVEPKTRGHYQKWYDQNRRYLHPGDDGKLTLDEEAERLNIAYDEPQFFEAALEALGAPATAGAARTLLARYVPEGPGAEATAKAWEEWYEAHAPYLFFSEWGGFRWYVDPLAESRGVPTAQLRGSDRADVKPDASESGGDR